MNDDERKWREKVDHEQITLMTGHQVLDARVDKIEEIVGDLDETIRGNSKDEIGGLVARLREMEFHTTRLNAIIFVDSTGKKGLKHDVEELLEGREDRRTVWKSWKEIAVAIIMSGTIGYFWPEIKAKIEAPRTDIVGKEIELAVHPRPHHRHIVVHEEADDGNDDTR